MEKTSKKLLLNKLTLWLSSLGIIAIVFDFGFSQHILIQQAVDIFYFLIIIIGFIAVFNRYLKNKKLFEKKVFIFDSLYILTLFYILFTHLVLGEAFKTTFLFKNPIQLVFAVILIFIREASEVKLNLKKKFLNPAQLFILSFLFIIFLGTLLLMLPRATYNGISFIDAFFTSTSAVCVTGLVVVDTGTYFTSFGQFIILLLIQIGGLGILTFASYFSYFFKGGTTYKNQLIISEMMNSKKVGEVFKTLKNIILITLVIEMSSAIIIFFSINNSLLSSFSDKVFFSVFHSISAFCNAGFSTLSNSIYETNFRFNYPFQLVLIITFFLGGLGFPIVVNTISYLKHKAKNILTFSKKTYYPWDLNINSRITLITTLSLTIIAFVLFFILEYHNTLAEHDFFGKVITALFGASTPRTAGFNSVDMTSLSLPTIMLTILLMWVGASPTSTGGGIKTSTFAIAFLNFMSLAKGKDRVEIFHRKIADISIKRAFATISLSLMVIAIAIGIIATFNPKLELLKIIFESFSAYSTVGLSLGISSNLNNIGKLVIIATMFIGRVSMLSIVVALFKKVKYKNYRYPTEEITIN